MDKRSWLSDMGRVLAHILLIDAGIVLATGLFFLLLDGHRLYEYGQGLTFIGALVGAAGLFSLMGASWRTVSPNNWYMGGAMPSLPDDHVQSGTSGSAPVLTMASAGVLAVIGGMILQMLAPLM